MVKILIQAKGKKTNHLHRVLISIKTAAFLFSACLLFLGLTTKALATTYYMDATDGADGNNGLTELTAWQTIGKVNTVMDGGTIVAGDSVLFQRGETFTGFLDVDVSGTSGSVITFGDYGSGAKPIINAAGNLRGVDIRGNSYLAFENLHIKNRDL